MHWFHIKFCIVSIRGKFKCNSHYCKWSSCWLWYKWM